MAKANRNLKSIEFSSPEIKQFVEERTADISAQTHTSKAYIIEQILLDGLLPKDEDMRFIIRNYLYASSFNDIQKTLSSFFSTNSMGEHWASRHSNCESLVDFCINKVVGTCSSFETHNPIPHMLSQLDSIIRRIDRCAQQCIELEDRAYFEAQLSYAKKLYQVAETSPSQINVKDHFQLVRDCWLMLNNWSITYRYLMDLCDMAQFEEDTQTRNELFNLLFVISNEWGKE